MKNVFLPFPCVLAAGMFVGAPPGAGAASSLSFSSDVQPILSEYCFHCHGPDGSSRKPTKAPLRVDDGQSVFAPRASGKPVVVPGEPDASLLIRLVESQDKNEVMPPDPSVDKHGKIMPPEKQAILRRWVAEGAEYHTHWAFVAPKKAALPKADSLPAAWKKHPIDRLVGHRFAEHGLVPNKRAEQHRQLRRLFLDLTGLPPSVVELEAIAADTRPFDAVYADWVDRLMKTDAYAEHWTRHWLDVARYGDTHGIHNDNYRSIWPYRDWVLKAFQNNMRFDQFTVDQLAGDLLPEAGLQEKIATGFLRCLPTTGEGGAIADEYFAIYAQDRVDTMSAAWLGLTTGCAACHDHKFDPLPTRDNYALAAFFRNSSMSALDRNAANHPPSIPVMSEEDQTRRAVVESEEKALAAQVKEREAVLQAEFPAWVAGRPWEASTNQSVRLHAPLSVQSNGFAAVVGEASATTNAFEWVEGPYGQGEAVVLKGGKAIDFGIQGDFKRDQGFGYAVWVKPTGNASGPVLSKMNTAKGFRGYDLLLGGGIQVHIVSAWPKNALKVSTEKSLPAGKWSHVLMTYNGSSKASGVALFVDGVKQKLKVEADSLKGAIQTDAPLVLGKRSPSSAISGAAVQEFVLFDHVLSDDDAALFYARTVEAVQPSEEVEPGKEPAHWEALRPAFLAGDADLRKLTKNRMALTKEKVAIDKRAPVTLVMDDKPKQEAHAHVLIRGHYADLGERVTPDTPGVLPPMGDLPRNRLGLAQWLMQEDHPLASRVTVNRYWYYLFGRGLVGSGADFGVMGERPTHPQLLDWLAVDFVESGWDLHHLLRTMVLSETYRQSGSADVAKRDKDPDNRWLSRGPRYRLDAEEIRDLALAASGLLHSEVGGPSVKPYQPNGIWETIAMKGSNTRNYKQDSGDKLYRRSVYTFWKRIAPPPSMAILNAPTREMFCVQRERTNTPLQAFVTMNDPQFVEASRRLAETVLQEATETDRRLDAAFLRILARKATPEERAILHRSLVHFLERFASDPAAAVALMEVGEAAPSEGLHPSVVAAWTLVTNQIFNMDEALNK